MGTEYLLPTKHRPPGLSAKSTISALRSRIQQANPLYRQSTLSEPHHSSLYTMHEDETRQPPDFATVSSSVLGTLPLLAQHSRQMFELTQESHSQRLAIQDGMASDKGTQTAYTRHLRNYEIWWEKDQARRMALEAASADSSNLSSSTVSRVLIPAHPINATKVALFLTHETSRAKVCELAIQP